MVVVKGGVWTNIEDEILKASVSKYGLNQWARVSSLLARKTPKQCKARWAEWLDPGIRKIEWSKDEDEKLLHLAKLMPTQWRTIAPIVGRTATQCLERYQKLLDEAEAKDGDEFGLAGPEGGEHLAPTADSVRRLRPGEVDPDPESKPARPDTIDMDEDEKEMLSEARARLANTQGKKAKRKARERQLEESRRLANLQKRRELKTAGINVRITSKKKGQMDYNADIPFEHAPAAGFYDTIEEKAGNEDEREAFDPRKQQIAMKRKGDAQNGDGEDRKRQKNNQDGTQAAFAAAAKAAQLQRIREAEQSSKRKALVLPAPQVSESELEDIVKMGMTGQRANQAAIELDNDATRGLVGNYEHLVGATPIRTPRAPQEEDRIANEARNARLRTQTQSALFGGENAQLEEAGTTGYDGITPAAHASATPNPLATPMRQGLGPGATPMRGPSATPMRTPRDTLRLNADGAMQLANQTPQDMRRYEKSARNDLRSKLASLPKPKEVEWELEVPEEQDAPSQDVVMTEEDAAIRDQREKERLEAAAKADLRRQSQVVQRGLPRPSSIDLDALLAKANTIDDPIKKAISQEMAYMMAHDATRFGGAKVHGKPRAVPQFDQDMIDMVRMEIALEVNRDAKVRAAWDAGFVTEYDTLHQKRILPGLDGYGEDELDQEQLLTEAFDNMQETLTSLAEQGNVTEKRLTKHHGGYIARNKMLLDKISEAATYLEKLKSERLLAEIARTHEDTGIRERLDKARAEVGLVGRLEREAQEVYRVQKHELDALVA